MNVKSWIMKNRNRQGCVYSGAPIVHPTTIKVLNRDVPEKLKGMTGSNERVKHYKLDVGNLGVWCQSMVNLWEGFTDLQKWRVYERLIVAVRIVRGEAVDEGYFHDLRLKYGVKL